MRDLGITFSGPGDAIDSDILKLVVKDFELGISTDDGDGINYVVRSSHIVGAPGRKYIEAQYRDAGWADVKCQVKKDINTGESVMVLYLRSKEQEISDPPTFGDL